MKQREIFFISIIVFLTILSWLVIDIYYTKTTGKENEAKIKMPKKLNLKIDTNLFKDLEIKN